MAKKTHSSPQPSSQTSHAHKSTPDPTQTTPLPSKPSSLSSQPQPLQIQPLSTIHPISPSNPDRPNRSKRPTPVAAAAAAAANSFKRPQRFSTDDVVHILTSLSDFKSKTGKDALKHFKDFHNSLNDSVRVKTTERKLREKIRILRIKFENNNGKFSCPFDEEVFKLSEKIWGQDCEVEEKEKSPQEENAAKKPSTSMKLMLVVPPKKEHAVKKPSTSKKPISEEPPEKENDAKKTSKKPIPEEPPEKDNAAKKPSTSKKPIPQEPPEKESAAKKPSTLKKLMLGEPPKKENAAKKPSTSKKPIPEELSAVIDKEPAKGGSGAKIGRHSLSEMFRFDEMHSDKLYRDVTVLKRGMELIGESEREELETRWKKLKVQEAELFLKRAELAEDQGRSILKELQGLS